MCMYVYVSSFINTYYMYCIVSACMNQFMCMYALIYVYVCVCIYFHQYILYVLYCICLYEPVYASRAHAAMISYSGCEPEEDWKLLVEVFPSSFSGSS